MEQLGGKGIDNQGLEGGIEWLQDDSEREEVGGGQGGTGCSVGSSALPPLKVRVYLQSQTFCCNSDNPLGLHRFLIIS